MEGITRNNTHTVFFIQPDDSKEFACPYILAVPHNYNENESIILESNNQENPTRIVTTAVNSTLDYLFSVLYHSKNTNPILIPLLPSVKDGRPYFQQLSKECFDESRAGKFHRIDEQVVAMIDDAKRIITGLTGKSVNNQVFLHGYSSSGVFAQRFALLHPELVKAACIGGAIGSFPLPVESYKGTELAYPLGISDYQELTGKVFNLESYKKIKFSYYVTEGENERKTESRLDEQGAPAPMCDMSYMDRSVPIEVGQAVRNCFGIDSFERFNAQLMLAEGMGMTIEYHPPYEGLAHHNIGGAAGEFIGSCITECNASGEKNINISPK